MTKKRIDLSIGGADWDGWHFGPWGRAKGWRLHDPNGTNYIASEIAQLRPMEYNVDYLQVKVKEVEAQIAEIQRPLMQGEIEALQVAIALLTRLAGQQLIKLSNNPATHSLKRKLALFR